MTLNACPPLVSDGRGRGTAAEARALLAAGYDPVLLPACRNHAPDGPGTANYAAAAALWADSPAMTAARLEGLLAEGPADEAVPALRLWNLVALETLGTADGGLAAFLAPVHLSEVLAAPAVAYRRGRSPCRRAFLFRTPEPPAGRAFVAESAMEVNGSAELRVWTGMDMLPGPFAWLRADEAGRFSGTGIVPWAELPEAPDWLLAHAAPLERRRPWLASLAGGGGPAEGLAEASAADRERERTRPPPPWEA